MSWGILDEKGSGEMHILTLRFGMGQISNYVKM